VERLQARILEALIGAEGDVTPQRMVQLVGQSFALVNRALRNLEAAGAVVKRRGAYTAAPTISPARAAKAIAPPEPGLVPIGARLAALLESGRVS
jgi:DNA-binding GntR family transcriptional regulator